MKVTILHLPDGIHEFEESIAARSLHFYSEEKYPEQINVKVTLNKFGKNISCKVHLSTNIHLTCDRCLTEFQKPVAEKFEILFHIGTRDFETDEEDVVMLSPEENEIELDRFIEEQLVLAVPIKALCREDCKGLCPVCGVNLNVQSCNCPKETLDPRWQKLKELL